MKENIMENRDFSIDKFKDCNGLNLSNKDFKNISLDVLRTLSFDTQTKWPSKEKLPIEFNPEIILENGKDPGLGLKELHRQGFTGKGINVAIIDQKLDLNHEEYSSNIVDYKEFGKAIKEEISMHGPAVASLLVGKNCGVAPDAKLHYKAASSGSYSNWDEYSESLNKIIDYNEKAKEDDKIRIVSCSNGYPNSGFKGSQDNWEAAIKNAKSSGIIFIDGNEFVDLNYNGGGSIEDKEDVDKYNEWLAIEGLKQGKPILGNLSKLVSEGRIVVPCDYRTVASSWNKKNGYGYHAKGGISWSIPYLAGICSLVLQINKNLTIEEITKIVHDTASENRDGIKVINPKAVIESVVNSL